MLFFGVCFFSYFKYAVTLGLRIGSAHNKAVPTDINISEIFINITSFEH